MVLRNIKYHGEIARPTHRHAASEVHRLARNSATP